MFREELNNSPSFELKPRWHTPCYENLNKLDWAGGFGVICHGVEIGIRVSDSSLIPKLQKRLPADTKSFSGDEFDAVMSVILGGKQPGSSLRNFHLVYHNHTVMGRSHRQEEALDRFGGFFALAVAMLSPHFVFVHAGAVEWQGQALLIPGQSLAGKSTLVMELVRAGATYLSDEFALLDNKGMVHPYPKPISMRESSQSKQIDVSVESFGGTIATNPVPLGFVFDTTYKKGAHWKPKHISPGQGVLATLTNCPAAQYAPERVLDALNTAAINTCFIRTLRGDAAAIAPLILQSISEGKLPNRDTHDFASIQSQGRIPT